MKRLSSSSRLKDIPVHDRPQERLIRLGASPLSDRELLAMLIRSGTARSDVLALTDELLNQAGSLAGLLRWDTTDFMKISGIGSVKALQLTVMVEIAKRMASGNRLGQFRFTDSKSVWEHLYPETRTETVEKVWVLCLDRRNKLIRGETVTSGTATGSLVHPREVFRPAIRHGATAVILAHNHPSGDPSPSPSDLRATKKICEAASFLDLDFHDHVILGEPENCPRGIGFFSFSEEGLL